MAVLKFRKVDSLPGVLEGNCIYILRNGSNHILHITDEAGTVTYKSYDSVDIATISSAYIDSLIGIADGIAGLDSAGLLESKIKIKQFTADFGSTSEYSKSFTINDAEAVTTSKIIPSPSASMPNGRDSDELEMDNFSIAAVCKSNGVITFYIKASPGPVSGQYNFNYYLG